MDKIDELVEAALKQVNATSSLENIGRALEIAKSATENAKTNQEIKTWSAQIRAESLKTWAAILVPIVSILALLATVMTQMYQQHSQLQANRQQNEDTQWRDLLSSLHGGSSTAISDISLVPRLRSFFNAATYGTQAIDLSKRLMGKLANYGAFIDLFVTVFPTVEMKNLNDVVDIDRILNQTTQGLFEHV